MARAITVARLFYQLEANTKGLDRELQGAEKSLGRTATFIKNNPAVALAALGTAMVGVAVKATEMAAKFESSMAEVSTLVDTTSVDMKQLADGVLGLYRNLPVENIDDLTKGLYNVISAGVPAGEAIEFLDIAARAAVGGVTDVNTAVNGLTTATNAFATQGLTAQEAADKFFTAVRLGKTTFAEISGSIGNVAGLANSLGVSLDDLLSNMTALTLGGLDTSVAFNSLRQILANVAKPTAELKREYPALAKEFDLTALKTKGLTGFMTELAGKLKGNDDAAVKMFGSVEALNAVLGLTADGGARLNSIQDQMANSAGASAEAFDKMAATNKALHQVLKNEFAVQMIQLGEKLLPLVNAGLRAAITLFEFLNGTIGKIKGDAAANTINTISTAMDRLGAESRARDIDRLGDALAELGGARASDMGDNFAKATAAVSRNIDKLTTQDLQRLYQGFAAAANSGELAEIQMIRVTGSLRAIGAELTSRGDQIIPAAAVQSLEAAAEAADTTTTSLGRVGPAAEDAAKKAKEAADRYAAGMKRITEILVQSTVTLVDDTELAIARLRDELQAAGIAGENAARALRPFQDQLRLIKLNERLALPEILKKSAQAWTPNDVARLREAEGALREMLSDTSQLVPQTQAWKQASEQHAEVSKALFSTTLATKEQVMAAIRPTQEWKDRAKELGYTLDENGKIVGKTTDEVVKQKMAVADVARAAIGVAEGFGLIDSKAAAVLQNVVSIADNLAGAMGGDPTSIFAVLGGLTGVIGALFSGDSAEERARKELIRKNTEAIRELERTNGNLLRINSPGFKISGVRDVLSALEPTIAAVGTRFTSSASIDRAIGERLLQAGLTIGDLEELAKNLGLQIRDQKTGLLSIPSVLKLLEGLTSDTLTRFADEINEQFERIKTGIELGVIDPADELSEILKVLSRPELGKGVPVIARAFQGVNVGTTEGRAQARLAVQDLFRQLETGSLKPDDFGGLSGREFRDLLVQLFGFLKEEGEEAPVAGEPDAEPGTPPTRGEADEEAGPTIQPSPGVAGGVGEGIDDSDTVGTRIPATLDDLLGVNEEANRFLEEILASINSSPLMRPPVLPKGFLTQTAPGAGASNTTITFGDIVVHVAGTSASAQDIAHATRQSLEETIDRLLYERLQRERSIRGDGGLN